MKNSIDWDNDKPLRTAELLLGRQSVPEEGLHNNYPEGFNVVIYNNDKTDIQSVFTAIKQIGHSDEAIINVLSRIDSIGYCLVYNSNRDFPISKLKENSVILRNEQSDSESEITAKKFEPILKKQAYLKCLEIISFFSSIGVQAEIIEG